MKTNNYARLNCIRAALLLCALTMILASTARADLQVHSIDGKILGVHFDQIVQSPSCITISNYTVYGKTTGTITVTNAVLQDDEQTVALYLNSSAGEFFIVGVSNIVGAASSSNINTLVTGYLNYYSSTSIGSATNPAPAGEVVSFFRDSFKIDASGSDIGGTNDHCHFVYQTVVSNFDMTVFVNRLDNTDPAAKAGLMARENNNPGSRSVGVYLTPLSTLGSNQIVTVYRNTTNGNAGTIAQPVPFRSLTSLRMVRSNNVFTVYYSSNNFSWTSAGSISQAWNATMNIGPAVTSHTNGTTTTAGFSGLNIDAARPGDTVKPTLSVAFVSNNIVARWQRTPRDFAVQVTDSLGSAAPSTGGTTNDPSPWAFLLLPIYDTSITGTNAYSPAGGRYMTIPPELFGGNAMFVRMAQVEKVFPDPVEAKGGVCLSSKNFASTNAGNMLCSGNLVNSSSSVTLTNNTYVICWATNSYKFSTENSGPTIHTDLQLRNRVSGLNYYFAACIGSNTVGYAANNYKAMVTLPMSTAISNYTFVVAATSDSPATTPIYLDITIVK